MINTEWGGELRGEQVKTFREPVAFTQHLNQLICNLIKLPHIEFNGIFVAISVDCNRYSNLSIERMQTQHKLCNAPCRLR